MTLPVGTISMSQVNTELGISPSSTLITLNQANVRALAGVPTGTISMNNLRGKSALWTGTIASNQTNLDLYTWATTVASPAYPGSGSAQITISPGVYVYSTAIANAGLTIPSSFTAGALTLINNGFIMGKGGNGGDAVLSPTVATAGGTALSVNTPIILTNNSFIAGGGGGGGGAPMATAPAPYGGGGGGGAGGGTGGLGVGPTTTTGFPGGAGGAVGLIGSNANASGAGGGGGGYGASGGIGYFYVNNTTNTSGAGGPTNQAGGNASLFTPASVTAPGAAGGKAIALNGKTITYPATGTIWGSIA